MITFFHKTAEALARTHLPSVAAAVGLYVIGLVLTGERWRVILTSMGAQVTLLRAVLVNLAGIFVRNVTPTSGLGGDAVRVALLRTAGVPLHQATISFVCARLVEIPAVIGLTLLALPAFGTIYRAPAWKALAVIGLAALGGVVAIRGPVRTRLAAWWQRVATAQPPIAALVSASLWAAASWGETTVRLMIVAAAVGVPLSLSQGCALAVCSIVGGFVPTVGSLGAIEGSMMAGLLLFGVPAGPATAITIIERAISYGLSTAAGAAALGGLGGSDLLRHRRASRN